MFTNETTCPLCGEEYDETASQLRPVWSDEYDNIVCISCKEEGTQESGLNLIQSNGKTYLTGLGI